jgi:hypothetical protein
MGYYSDPTANMALGQVNREFSQQVKKAKRILKLYKEGKISDETLEKAHAQFKGLYRYVLQNVIEEDEAQEESEEQ